MSIEGQAPTPAEEPIEIECNVETSAKKNWSCCDLLQYCAKCDELDDQVRRKNFGERPENYDDVRADGNDAAATYRAGWNAAAANGTIAAADQGAVQNMFYHECAYQQAQANDFEIGPEMQPDHVVEIQAGGSATNLGNLKWLSTSVNRSVQSVSGKIGREYDSSKDQTVEVDCCPAEQGYCNGKTPSQPVLP